ncbi:hypothetical protein [Actinoplanes sp. NPDC051411]|uniref:hypothetical protein n=1 Tax=Actinoplanes sp. NPDC051411 TaxID=3155522 RepID=UPI003440A588
MVCADGLERTLLELAARATEGRDGRDLDGVPVLGRRPLLSEDQRRPALALQAQAQAVPVEAAVRIDAEAVARWIIDHYREPLYPAAVVGSPHGAAVHMAAALGAAWLPAAFPVTVAWPCGSIGRWEDAMQWGAAIARPLLAAQPGVTVRQVHDPVRRGSLCGTTVALHLRWRQLPAAYRTFLRSRIATGGHIIVIRDARTWPVSGDGPGYTFQIGSPVSGTASAGYAMGDPSFRRLMHELGARNWGQPPPDLPPAYAETAGEPGLDAAVRRLGTNTGRPVHHVLYPGPDALSAFVADSYRSWLATAGAAAPRCVVETGRLLDPWRVLAGGMVPYWCESPARPAVDAAEWWLAASSRFADVTVLPDPPGVAFDGYATLAQWHSLARFGPVDGSADRVGLNRYPLLPLPTGHAGRVLSSMTDPPWPVPPLMPVAHLMASLHEYAVPLGLFVT